MRYIEALEEYKSDGKNLSLFLAGGITNCPDWQAEVVAKLKDCNLVLLNPRRKHFPIHDTTAAEKQILWEFNYLREADAILFWFPCETLCPIVLYELGAWSFARTKPLFVGTHLTYARRQDVEIQTKFVRPEIVIKYSLDNLVKDVYRWEKENGGN